MNAVATAPAYTTPDGGAVYLTELPELRGLRFFHAIMFDADGLEVAEFPSLGETHLTRIATDCGWEKVEA